MNLKIQLFLPLLLLTQSAFSQQTFVVKTKMIEGKHVENIEVTVTELHNYIASKRLKDTTGKQAALLTTIASARMLVKYGAEPNLEAGLKRAEYYFAHKDDVDKILVLKSKRQMHLMKNGKIIRTFPISLGFSPVGQKVYEGDGKTPEGIYTLDGRNFVGETITSFHISYPNDADKERAQKKGLKAGSYIMVHGTEGTKKRKDFTNGCIALSNTDLENFRKLVFVGTTIEIRK